MTTERFEARPGTTWTVPSAKYPGLWKVVSNTGTVNAVLTPVDAEGNSRGATRLRAPYAMLTPAQLGQPEIGVPFVARESRVVGELVTFVKPGVYVVIADKGERVNLALLGGENGRYWRAFAGDVKAATKAEVLAHLEVARAWQGVA